MSRGANGAPAAVSVLKSRRARISAEALMERTGRNSGLREVDRHSGHDLGSCPNRPPHYRNATTWLEHSRFAIFLICFQQNELARVAHLERGIRPIALARNGG
jgi:hypothetical protein